ncbi:hypothetical protein RB614_43165 [Phytohabitans sp. ZYX-F-186]|uniref:HEAT repeat domain-containing protein n=1 Tax=Phytohabitans maris TaxID=3071409 RepID=A0ABU0ZW98_9ACTN|nr:hypothetical protein [Phytohabitans sp. ZYX-F-186]MDQ7911311.1 hypothetical protein [Phytohabitans sp. ZYX-F-186]
MQQDVCVRHKYHVFRNPPPATAADVRAALDRGDVTGALEAMVGSALYNGVDWKEPQELFLQLLEHEDRQVSALAATCLGHLARVYGQLDEDRVVAALHRARCAPHISGTALNALEDIEVFLHPWRARWRGRLWTAIRPRRRI